MHCLAAVAWKLYAFSISHSTRQLLALHQRARITVCGADTWAYLQLAMYYEAYTYLYRRYICRQKSKVTQCCLYTTVHIHRHRCDVHLPTSDFRFLHKQSTSSHIQTYLYMCNIYIYMDFSLFISTCTYCLCLRLAIFHTNNRLNTHISIHVYIPTFELLAMSVYL